MDEIEYNIWSGKYWQQIIEFLRVEAPTIACLQEVAVREPHHAEVGHIDLVHELTTALPQYQVIFAPIKWRVHQGKSQGFGNAILSRAPIVSHRAHYFFKAPDWSEDATSQARHLLEARLKVQGSFVHVYTTHLTVPGPGWRVPDQQLAEANQIVQRIGTRHPAILMGDLNALPTSTVLRTLKSRLPHDDGNLSPTFSRYPFSADHWYVKARRYKIDYVLTSSDVRFETVRVPRLPYSDHLPIIATVTL